MELGTLFIISAPSGAGKTSLVSALLKNLSHLQVSISHTTRAPRAHEQEGVNYYFINNLEFQSMIEQRAFLEHAKVFDHYYGTSRDKVLQHLQMGCDVILEIDWQGAAQVRHLMPESVSIFILPPSREILLERLHKRGQDDPVVIGQRMAKAKDEMRHYAEFDYLVINDDFNQAIAELQTIILNQRLKQPRQAHCHTQLIQQLLN